MLLDLWLKRIWLLIGCLILLVGLVAAIVFVASLFTGHDHTGPLVGASAAPQGQDSLVSQDLAFDFPRPIGRTGLLSVAVYVKDLSSAIPKAELSVSKQHSEMSLSLRGMVNILFVNTDGSPSRPLLERRGLIKRADIPGEADSLAEFNLYDISFEDTDHDGRLTMQDSSRYFVSDLDGQHLAPLLSDKADELVSYTKSRDRKAIYLLLKHRAANIKPVDWPERLYVFNVATRSLTRFPKDSQILEHMHQVLWSR